MAGCASASLGFHVVIVLEAYNPRGCVAVRSELQALLARAVTPLLSG